MAPKKARGAAAASGAADPFFDRFRAAMARLPAGLLRVGPPAAAADITAAERALGRPLPAPYASFLRSFDGADLFHESVAIAGVGNSAPRRLASLQEGARPGELMFAEAIGGDRFAFDDRDRVVRYDPGSEERIVAGSDLVRWLDAIVAREQLLFDRDGEYAPDVFDPAGQDVLPAIALRQAERALRADPGSADAAYAQGLALVQLGRREPALAALRHATRLDPDSPWPYFDLGRESLALGHATDALEAFENAAARAPTDSGGHILAWAARAAQAAGDSQRAAALRQSATERDPSLLDSLRRALASATEERDEAARAEAAALLEAMASSDKAVRRLPVISR